jgi:hypothetical protein
MSLQFGDLASADGPYLRADGSLVDLDYLEIVYVLKPANADGEVYVVGWDSHEMTYILESSLTPITGQKRPII